MLEHYTLAASCSLEHAAGTLSDGRKQGDNQASAREADSLNQRKMLHFHHFWRSIRLEKGSAEEGQVQVALDSWIVLRLAIISLCFGRGAGAAQPDIRALLLVLLTFLSLRP